MAELGCSSLGCGCPGGKPGAPALNILVKNGGPGCGIWIPSKAVSEAPEVGPICGPGLPHVWRSKLALPRGATITGASWKGGVVLLCCTGITLLSECGEWKPHRAAGKSREKRWETARKRVFFPGAGGSWCWRFLVLESHVAFVKC